MCDNNQICFVFFHRIQYYFQYHFCTNSYTSEYWKVSKLVPNPILIPNFTKTMFQTDKSKTFLGNLLRYRIQDFFIPNIFITESDTFLNKKFWYRILYFSRPIFCSIPNLIFFWITNFSVPNPICFEKMENVIVLLMIMMGKLEHLNVEVPRCRKLLHYHHRFCCFCRCGQTALIMLLIFIVIVIIIIVTIIIRYKLTFTTTVDLCISYSSVHKFAPLAF